MTDVERKIRLTRFLREENAVNRMQMRSREEILYGSGKGSDVPLVYEGYLEDGGYKDVRMHRDPAAGSVMGSSFGVRMVLAVFLLGAVIYMDRAQTAMNGHLVSEMIESNLKVDLEEELADFVNAFNGG